MTMFGFDYGSERDLDMTAAAVGRPFGVAPAAREHPNYGGAYWAVDLRAGTAEPPLDEASVKIRAMRNRIGSPGSYDPDELVLPDHPEYEVVVQVDVLDGDVDLVRGRLAGVDGLVFLGLNEHPPPTS